ncbi:TetR/AcrR family transcriptional regulator [Flexivirga endophytica]|uniref:TetR/AcrR family transcriptional regulator n=1 Tax=Flexivirga endophytica TaxID=1849103 RepID=UPI001E61F251|nr:TetR/AcrR family transcriptional regulator [Flexivirga endophytica]
MTSASPADEDLRTRLLRVAATMTVADGWSKMTMSRLADEAGVSRQSVYNTFGSKPALAQALVMSELSVFLGKVVDAFEGSGGDPVKAVHDAALGVLLLSRKSPLLRAAVAGSHGANSELLPLLTTDNEQLLATAKRVVTDGMLRFQLPLDRAQLDIGVDVIVRTVLSHVIQPSSTPEKTATGIAWVASAVLHWAE